jgi:hypothetical protein
MTVEWSSLWGARADEEEQNVVQLHEKFLKIILNKCFRLRSFLGFGLDPTEHKTSVKKYFQRDLFGTSCRQTSITRSGGNLWICEVCLR